MDYKKLADMLFPNVEHDADYYLDIYKKRNLSAGLAMMIPPDLRHAGKGYPHSMTALKSSFSRSVRPDR